MITRSISLFLRLIAIFFCLSFTAFISAAPKHPNWLKKTPLAGNSTYYYDRQYGEAEAESIAYNIAYTKMVQNAMSALGVTYRADDVNTAMRTGRFTNFEGIVVDLPIRVVCSYTEILKSGAYRVYVLGQVGKASTKAASVMFEEFQDCEISLPTDGGKLVDQRPSAWTEYMSGKYEYKSVELDIEQDRLSCQHAIETQVRQSLISSANLKDTALCQLVEVKSHLGKNRAYAIACIEKKNIAKYYRTCMKNELKVCQKLLERVDAYIDESRTGDAKALVNDIKKKMEQMDIWMTYNEANSSVDVYEELMGELIDEYNGLKEGVTTTEVMTKDGDKEQRNSKIIEYMDLSDNAIHRNEVGNALRYLYAAQLLLADSPSSQFIKVMDPVMGEVKAMVAIPEKIKRILEGVTVVCDGTLPGNKQELKLSFIYNNDPIMGINFMYNCNLGWSDFIATKNGWATAFLPENNTLNQIHVMLDYRCATEANFDVELPELYEKYQSRFNYDEAAKKIVSVKLSDISIPTTQQADSLVGVTTNMQEKVVLDNVQKHQHSVSANDSAKYAKTILAVCEALKTNKLDYQSLSPYFTSRGMNQYKKLLNYGNIRIISTDGCRFVRIGQEVQCRSIPVSFSFSKGKIQYENLVFTLLDPVGGKIDGVQFSLEERSLTNIMEDKSIDETARLALVNFMENYKTAFAFQDWDYVASIFSDDAIIITGRVIKRQETMADGRQTIINDYKLSKQSKEQYIRRLRATTKEWINIKFGSTLVEGSKQKDIYGLSMSQDYYSNNYGDHGYLFLLIDNTDPEQPLIRIRAWQPNEHFDMGKFAELEQAHREGKL